MAYRPRILSPGSHQKKRINRDLLRELVHSPGVNRKRSKTPTRPMPSESSVTNVTPTPKRRDSKRTPNKKSNPTETEAQHSVSLSNDRAPETNRLTPSWTTSPLRPPKQSAVSDLSAVLEDVPPRTEDAVVPKSRDNPNSLPPIPPAAFAQSGALSPAQLCNIDQDSPLASASPLVMQITKKRHGEVLLDTNAEKNRQLPAAFGGNELQTWLRSEKMLTSVPTSSASSLKREARHDFQLTPDPAFQKPPHVTAANPLRSSKRGRRRKGDFPPEDFVPSTATAESSGYHRYLLEEFMCLPVGDWILLQVSQDHPHFAFWMEAYGEGGPLPVNTRHPSSRDKPQPCCIQLHCQVKRNERQDALLKGRLLRRQVTDHLRATERQPACLRVSVNGGEGNERVIEWNYLLEHAETFEVWGKRPFLLDFQSAFRRLRNPDSQKRLFNHLSIECNHDVAMTHELCNVYQGCVSGRLGNDDASLTPEQEDIVEHLKPEVIGPISKRVDKIAKEHFQSCCGAHVNLHSPLLGDDILDDVTRDLKNSLPAVWAALYKMLGYDEKARLKRNQHLVLQHDRFVLFELASLCRVRNKHTFVWFGAMLSMVSCGTASSSDALSRALVCFGNSITNDTVINKLEGMNSEDATMENALKETNKEKISFTDPDGISKVLKTCFAVFDNTQKNFPFWWQRGEHASKFVRATSRVFVKLWQGPWKSLPIPREQVQLTCVDQPMPSPFFLPPFETLGSTWDVIVPMAAATTTNPFPLNGAPIVDLSGKRVEMHAHHIRDSVALMAQKHNLACNRLGVQCQPEEHNTDGMNDFRDIVREGLKRVGLRDGRYKSAKTFWHPCVSALRGQFSHHGDDEETPMDEERKRKLDTLRTKLAQSFRHLELKWLFQRPVSQLLPLPLAEDDETTNEGAASSVTKLQHAGGLLVPAEKGADVAWVAADDLEERWVIVCGDGLSCAHMRTYEKLLKKASTGKGSLLGHYHQMDHLLRAHKRFVPLPGDLHALGFHVLNAICRQHFGGFLQPICPALGWKHIQWQKTEKCYHHAATLVNLVITVLERQLHDAWLCQMPEEGKNDVRMMAGGDALKLSTHLLLSFQSWLNDRTENSTDEEFKRVLLFHRQMLWYQLGVEAVQKKSKKAQQNTAQQESLEKLSAQVVNPSADGGLDDETEAEIGAMEPEDIADPNPRNTCFAPDLAEDSEPESEKEDQEIDADDDQETDAAQGIPSDDQGRAGTHNNQSNVADNQNNAVEMHVGADQPADGTVAEADGPEDDVLQSEQEDPTPDELMQLEECRAFMEKQDCHAFVGKKKKRPVSLKRVKIHDDACKDLHLLGKEKLLAMDLVTARARHNERLERERLALQEDLRKKLEKLEADLDTSWIDTGHRNSRNEPERFRLLERLKEHHTLLGGEDGSTNS